MFIHTICGVIRNLHTQCRETPPTDNSLTRLIGLATNIRRLADSLTDEAVTDIVLDAYTWTAWQIDLEEHFVFVETLHHRSCSAEELRLSKLMLHALASWLLSNGVGAMVNPPTTNSSLHEAFCNCDMMPRTHQVSEVAHHFARHLALRIRLMIYHGCPPAERPADFDNDYETAMRMTRHVLTPRDYAHRCYAILDQLRSEWVK